AGACLAPGVEPAPGGVARSGPAAPGLLCPRTLASGAGAADPIPASAGAAPGRVKPQAAGAIGTCLRGKTWVASLLKKNLPQKADYPQAGGSGYFDSITREIKALLE